MGNIAVTINKVFVSGDRKVVSGTLTGSGSYATNGDSVPLSGASSLGLELELNDLDPKSTGTSRAWEWDGSRTAPKVKIFTAFGTEATNASSQSAVSVPFTAIGKGSAAA